MDCIQIYKQSEKNKVHGEKEKENNGRNTNKERFSVFV